MRVLWWARRAMLLCCALALPLSVASAGGPPAQKLPSALLVYPLIQATGDKDTRIELVNLSGNPVKVECFYVDGGSCNEVGFLVYLTPYQPLSWLASGGKNDVMTGTSVPPFYGTGEMKCAVHPAHPEVQYHNAIQGRAIVFGNTDGQSASYGAVGFQRLADGDMTGTFSLNGTTYAQCPYRLHFDVLTEQQPTSISEMILVPCTEDLRTQIPTATGVQVMIYNEFETPFSTAFALWCYDKRPLSAIADTLTRAVAGSDTAHVVIRGVGSPVLGLVIDEVPFKGQDGTAGNEPSFEGGRSATVYFPEPQ
ncbi:MAG: hypothetical protein U0587_11655 [Candidatus Binatia bacterium]